MPATYLSEAPRRVYLIPDGNYTQRAAINFDLYLYQIARCGGGFIYTPFKYVFILSLYTFSFKIP